MAIADFESKIAELSRVWTGTELAKGEPQVYSAFTDEFPTDGDSVKVADLLNVPQMERLVGKRKYTSLRAVGDNIPVRDYSKAIALPIAQVMGDRSGLVARKLGQLANAGGDKNKLATNALLAGFSDDGYDDVAFFSTSHPNGPNGATQSNLVSGALTHATFRTAKQALHETRDESGANLGLVCNYLMVGPKLEELAREIVKAGNRAYPINAAGAEAYSSAVAATSIENTVATQNIEVIVNRNLVGTYDDYWFVGDSNGARPVVMGVLVDATPSDNLGSGNYRETMEARFAVDLHAAIGLGFWQTIQGSTGA